MKGQPSAPQKYRQIEKHVCGTHEEAVEKRKLFEGQRTRIRRRPSGIFELVVYAELPKPKPETEEEIDELFTDDTE